MARKKKAAPVETRKFTVYESVTYTVEAKDKDEALAKHLADESEFVAVTERDIEEED